MDHNQQGQGPGRRHFHRGRRGPDRRGPDRRGPQAQTPEQAGARSDVDVEQIMRDIRARIAQRHGVELTNQQIQELAARRLESILDPRSIKPALLDQLRRAAGSPPDPIAAAPEPPYTFEDATLYESHRGLMRFIRRLLNPILKLFFNPNPLIRALNIQARLNGAALTREAERDRQQAEWNALHYEILHRVVTEISRVTLEVQNLSLRIESLAGKVDFNERRVRGIEGAIHQARPAAGRREEARRDAPETPPQVVVQAGEGIASEPAPAPAPQAQGQPAEGARRRRRRRRGRRGSGAPVEAASGAVADASALDADEPDEGPDEDEVVGIMADLPADLPAEAGSYREDAEAGSYREDAETSSDGEDAEGVSHGEDAEAGSRSALFEEHRDEEPLERDTHADRFEPDSFDERGDVGSAVEEEDVPVGRQQSLDAVGSAPPDVETVERLSEVVEEVVVVAEAQPRPDQPLAFEPAVQQPPAPSGDAAEQPEPSQERQPAPALPERRNLEPTDR